jgi:hypothetical protein
MRRLLNPTLTLACATRAAIILAVVATLLQPACAVAAAPRPNIIVILVDDMGFSDIGCYGSEIASRANVKPYPGGDRANKKGKKGRKKQSPATT